MEKSYEKVIEYVKRGIGSGEIQAGEKLLPERELAQKLEISRNSAREGLRILENMGVLESQQGAGIISFRVPRYGKRSGPIPSREGN